MNRLEEIIGREMTMEEKWFCCDLDLNQWPAPKPTKSAYEIHCEAIRENPSKAYFTPTQPKTAADILREAAAVIEQRAAVRDLPDGERSMARAVQSYNALTGSRMSELDGWIFMCVLKMARATAGKPHIDDFTDLAGYAALAAEGVA